ncbi:MAG: AraC family transcriptional regulator, partial [Bacteroidota bacterium]
NRFLALALFGVCVILFYEGISYLDADDILPVWIQLIPWYIPASIPVGIFYFVIYLIEPAHQNSTWEKLGFAMLGSGILVDSMYIPVNLFFSHVDQVLEAEEAIQLVSQVIGLLAALILVPWAMHKVVQYQKYLHDHYATTSGKSLAWLRNILVVVCAIIGLWLLSLIQYPMGVITAFELTFFVLTISLVALLFWTGYFVILQYSWFEIIPVSQGSVQAESDTRVGKLSSRTEEYFQRLKDMMHEQRVYETVDLTLESLAEQLQISSGYLSVIIREKEQKTFFEFINYHRIEAVKTKLLDPAFHQYTIMGIAMESGFKSKSTFNAVFKRFTGQTPSAYKKASA